MEKAEKLAVSKAVETSEELLAKLAADSNWVVRSNVAANPSTPEAVLALLATDAAFIRKNVAENPATASETLAILAQDGSCEVRTAIAQNPRTPHEILVMLEDSVDEGNIFWSLASNPATKPYLLHRLSKYANFYVREGVARNVNSYASTLKELSNDAAFEIRCSVANNLSTPESVLCALALDSNERVRKYATNNPSLYGFLKAKAVKEGYVATNYEPPIDWLISIYL